MSVVRRTLKALGEFVSVPVKLSAQIGMEEAAFLMYIVWKCERDGDETGWLSDSNAIEKELGLTRKQQFRLRKRLRDDLGVIEENENRTAHEMRFCVNDERFDDLVFSGTRSCQTAQPPCAETHEACAETPIATCQTAPRSIPTEKTLENPREEGAPATNSKGQTREEEQRFRQQAEEARQAQEDRRAKKANKGRSFQNRNSPIPFRPANQGGGTYGTRQSSEERRIAKQQRIREACERAQEKLAAGTL